MIRAERLLPREDAGRPADDRVVLDSDGRHRRRVTLTTARGERILLDLPKAVAMRHGERLALEDGRTVEIVAAPEPLFEIVATDAHHLARLAWHLGNRHVPAEIGSDRILIRRDHVLADMIRGLGGTVREVTAPFEPESGAYAHADGHRHEHGHGES